MSPKSNAIALPYLHKALAGENVLFEVELKDKVYAVNAVYLQRDNQVGTNILIVLYNITERKKAEKEVVDALKKQKELNELKSKFVSIASHEFRTPLSAILSSTFLISKYSELKESEKAQKHIDRITKSVHSLTDILNDFLSLGRIENEKVNNIVTEFDIIEFCSELVDDFQQSVKKDQHIVYHHEGAQKIIKLDRKHLQNVLGNLLSNASKYSSEGKTIRLSSSTQKGHLKFTVKDEGIGIPKEDQPNLFQTFFRANNASNIQGTGMGLHIVKKFLEVMGGTIEFSSSLNEGSSFTIDFLTGPEGHAI